MKRSMPFLSGVCLQTLTCDIVLATPEDIRQVTTKLQAALALAQQRW